MRKQPIANSQKPIGVKGSSRPFGASLARRLGGGSRSQGVKGKFFFLSLGPSDPRTLEPFLKSERGVASLIEIVAIVSILGILVAMAIANYAGARDRMLIRRSGATLNEVRQALKVYQVDTGKFPASTIVDTAFDSDSDPDCYNNDANPNNDLYTVLSAGLDTPPCNDFSQFVSYQGSAEGYTVVVRATDRNKTFITGTASAVTAGMGGQDLSELMK